MYLFQEYFHDGIEVREKYKDGVEIHVGETVFITPQLFVDELKTGLTILGADEKITLSEVLALDALVLNPLLELLSIFEVHDRAGAEQAAEGMITVLKALETEDTDLDKEVELIRTCLK